MKGGYFDRLTELIIGCAFRVGNELGRGFLEKVYENALAYELNKAGLQVVSQKSIQVYYDDVLVGDYVADLVVNNDVIIELKAVKNIDSAHVAQCLNYLRATGKRICLLINFGCVKVQVKRIVNDYDEE